MAKARKVLNSGNIGKQFIRNHYGRGYRFVATATVAKTTAVARSKKTQERQLWRLPPNNPEAYDYFLRGAEHVFRFTPEALLQARQMYEKAIVLDRQYAAAYAGLAWTYWLEWTWFWSPDLQTLERALALAQQAVALDDSLPLAHLTLGYVYLFKHQHARAIAEAERSIALDPHYAWAYGMLADMLTGVGRPQEALKLIDQAMRLEPQSAAYFSSCLGFAYRAMRQYEEAITAIQRTLTRNPHFVSARLFLAILYSETGRTEKAKEELLLLQQHIPHLSVEGLRQRFPYKDASETERVVSALSRAGLN